jgi:hypothetical protein
MPRVFERRAGCSGTVVHLGMGPGDPGPGPGLGLRLGVPASAAFSDPARILVGTGTGSPIGTGITTAAFDPPSLDIYTSVL